MPNIGNQMTALLLAVVFGLHLKLCLDLYAIKEKRELEFSKPPRDHAKIQCVFLSISLFSMPGNALATFLNNGFML